MIFSLFFQEDYEEIKVYHRDMVIKLDFEPLCGSRDTSRTRKTRSSDAITSQGKDIGELKIIFDLKKKE